MGTETRDITVLHLAEKIFSRLKAFAYVDEIQRISHKLEEDLLNEGHT
jgi:hypothetical protein